MKKLYWLVVLALLLVVVGVVLAIQPTADVFLDAGGNTQNDQELVVSSFGLNDSCSNIFITSFLRFALPPEATTTQADLTMTVSLAPTSGNFTVNLYEETTGTWTESDASGASVGSLLDSVDIGATPPAVGETVVFDSAALDTYLQSNAGGDVDFALQVTNCGVSGGTTPDVFTITFYDTEGGNGTPPDLSDPTAVAMRDSSATTDSNSIVFFLIAGIVLFLSASAFILARRREDLVA